MNEDDSFIIRIDPQSYPASKDYHVISFQTCHPNTFASAAICFKQTQNDSVTPPGLLFALCDEVGVFSRI